MQTREFLIHMYIRTELLEDASLVRMTNLHVCAVLFINLQKILEQLWKIQVSFPHASLKFKLSGTIIM